MLTETTSWITMGLAKPHQAPTYLWKLYVKAVTEAEAQPAVVQLKNEA